MGAVETVRIVSPRNPARCWRINKTDFDPGVHTLWEDNTGDFQLPNPDSLSLQELRSLARELGLKPDRRLGTERLREILKTHLQRTRS